MEEIWKLVPSLNNLYEVSNLAQVRPARGRYKGKILKQYTRYPNKTNYSFVEVYFNNKKHIRKVHRLVAEVFCENPNNYPFVMHIDSNPLNNFSTNLKWGTRSMNVRQCVLEGGFNKAKGSEHTNSKLTETQVIEIRSKYTSRKYSAYKLAKEYNVSSGLVGHILRRRNWTHV